jgi:hypothetical protein
MPRTPPDFPDNHLDIDEINAHFFDTEKALQKYFSTTNFSTANRDEKGAYYASSLEEFSDARKKRLDEQDRLASLTILASLDAAFNMDYLYRAETKQKDALSKALREIHKKRKKTKKRVSLESEILATWLEHTKAKNNKNLIYNLKGAFKYRHWLAHGRYWTPKSRQKYDLFGLQTLSELIFNCLPLYRFKLGQHSQIRQID